MSDAPLSPCQLCGDKKGRARDTCARPYRRTFYLHGQPRTVCLDCLAFTNMKRCKELRWEQLRDARRSGASMRIGVSQKDAVKAAYLKVVAEGVFPSCPVVAVRAGVSRSTAESWIRKMVGAGELTKATGGRKINVVLRAEHACNSPILDIHERVAFYEGQASMKKEIRFDVSPYHLENTRKEWQTAGPLLPDCVAAKSRERVEPIDTIVAAYKLAWKRKRKGLYLPLPGAGSLTPAHTLKKPKGHDCQYGEQTA